MRRLPTQKPAATSRADGFTLVELLVVIAIIGILVALLLPAVQAAREAARRMQCQANLKNVALAVLNFESTNKALPAAITRDGPFPNQIGTDLDYTSSWIIDCLPYLESQPLYDSFDFTQRIPGGTLGNTGLPNYVNVVARGVELPILKCPSDSNNISKFESTVLGDNWARGNYAANAGPANWQQPGGSSTGNTSGPTAPFIVNGSGEPSSPWRGQGTNATWPTSVRAPFGPNVRVDLAQLVDGTSKTMLLAEIRAGINEFDWRGAWALPHPGGSVVARHGAGGDDNGPNNCGPRADDMASSLAGGRGFSCLQMEDTLLNECMSCNDDNLFAQAAPRSVHVGGVFIAHVDGSVGYVSDDIETRSTCCGPWDQLIMGADEGFEFKSFR